MAARSHHSLSMPLSRAALFLRRPAVWVFLAALAARCIVLLAFRTSPFFGVQSGDMGFYDAWAHRIEAGEWTDRHAFYGMPGYAYLLAGFYFVFGGHFEPIFFLQCVLDACTGSIIFTITRRLLAFERDARAPLLSEPVAYAVSGIAALGWVVFLPAQAFAVVLMPTIWVIFGFWFIVSRLILDVETPIVRPWAALGVFMGMMATLIATILLLIPLVMAAIAARVHCSQPLKQRKAAVALAAVVFLAGVGGGCAPVWCHNFFIAHEPVFLSAHGGINFWIGNSPEANGYPKIPKGLRAGQQDLLQDSITIAEAAAGHSLTRRDVSVYWSKKAWEQIRLDPARWIRTMGIKVRNFWNAYVYDDVTIIALLREEEVLLPGIGFGPIALFGAAGVIEALARGGPGRWIACAVLLQMVALLPVFVTERYRMAAVPGLLILGSYGLCVLYLDLRQRRWGRVAAQVAVLVASGAAVFCPKTDAPRAMEQYNLGIAAMDVEELDRAQRHFQEAEVIAPEDPSLLSSMGTLWLKKGNLEKAKNYYARASRRDPGNFEVLFNEGIIAMQEKRWKDAETLFKEASSLHADGDAFFLMAQAQGQDGRVSEAGASLEEAIRLAPKRGFQQYRSRLDPRRPE